jgi:hypothetical protein
MRYQARFMEQAITAGEVNIVHINPFAGQGKKDRRVLISDNGAPVLVLQLYIRADEEGFLVSSAFCDFLCNDHSIAIICGDHLHIIPGHFRSFPLDDYVGHIYAVPDINSVRLHEHFLVATYSYVFLVHLTEGILWQSARCAIDGVTLSAIENDVIEGEGDWDPPGGWQPFRLSLKTGEPVCMD